MTELETMMLLIQYEYEKEELGKYDLTSNSTIETYLLEKLAEIRISI